MKDANDESVLISLICLW